jgi:hypothetical protein
MKNYKKQLKRLFFTLSCITFLFSCSETVDKKEFEDAEKIPVKKVEPKLAFNANPNAFADNLTAFKSCKEISKERSQCKEFIAKSICEYYGIMDLQDGGNYVDYDKIPEKLKDLKTWKKIGPFNERNIQLALEQLNSFNKPVLVFNNNESYVHVVALTPKGKTMKSRKWGNISVPSCVSFFPTRSPDKSFISKGVNYAFKSVDGLEIWTKI